MKSCLICAKPLQMQLAKPGLKPNARRTACNNHKLKVDDASSTGASSARGGGGSMNWQISSHWEDGALAEPVAAAQPGSSSSGGNVDVMPCEKWFENIV